MTPNFCGCRIDVRNKPSHQLSDRSTVKPLIRFGFRSDRRLVAETKTADCSMGNYFSTATGGIWGSGHSPRNSTAAASLIMQLRNVSQTGLVLVSANHLCGLVRISLALIWVPPLSRSRAAFSHSGGGPRRFPRPTARYSRVTIARSI